MKKTDSIEGRSTRASGSSEGGKRSSLLHWIAKGVNVTGVGFLKTSCSFAILAVVSAPCSAEIKIAVVDTQGVLSNSIVGKAAKNNVETELKKGQAKLAQLKADFEKATSDLGKQAAVLSGSALEERKEALEKKRTEYERAAMDLREGVMRKNDVELGKAVKEIESVVSEVAAEGEYTFIFERDRQTVVYASEGIDITDEVIKALDKKKVAL